MARTLTTYQQIVIQLLTQYSEIPYAHDDLADETIFDHDAGRYLLLTIGWQGHKRVNTIVLHLDVRIDNNDETVWIQCNNTDQDIANELVALGIPLKNIVIPVPSEIAQDSQLLASA